MPPGAPSVAEPRLGSETMFHLNVSYNLDPPHGSYSVVADEHLRASRPGASVPRAPGPSNCLGACSGVGKPHGGLRTAHRG